MSRSYSIGLRIILVTIVVSSALCVVGVRRYPLRNARAAEDLGSSAKSLGSFRLEERSGRTITDADLSGGVSIASFIFTSCPLSCPRISGVMKGLQERLVGSDVRLVSFSVDPEHDTAAVLQEYARRFGAEGDRWWFLTGSKSVIYDLIRDRFQLGVEKSTAPAGPDSEAFIHSDRLALIDHGRIAGLYDSTDPKALDALVAKARRAALPGWVLRLPGVNAALNGLSALLLLAGWLLIRRHGRSVVRPAVETTDPAATAARSTWDDPLVKGHVACMLAAIATSTLFLGCYLLYHFKAGSMPFAQDGIVRVAYLTILLSHTLLATASVPMILTTVRRGWRGEFARHVSIASLTFPIWLYVAVTGVVIYLMLYHLPAIELGSRSMR